MWQRNFIAAGLAAFCAACGVSGAADEDQLRTGAALFDNNCAVCHGAALKARPGMKDLRAFNGNFSDFRSTVTTGRGIMPGFEGVFSDGELEALYAYVRSGGKTGAGEE